MSAAVLSGDTPALQRAAHTLKGDAGTVGALEVAAVARMLEQHAQTEPLDDCEQLVWQLDGALRRARAAMSDLPLPKAA